MPHNQTNNIRIEGEIAYIELRDRHGELLAETMVDASDVPKIRGCGWYWIPIWAPKVRQYRVTTNVRGEDGKYRALALPRFLLEAPKGLMVDHINRNTLDNRRSNLRLVDCSANNLNRSAHRNNKTGVKNVAYIKSSGKYRVSLLVNGELLRFGEYDTLQEAAEIAERARRKYNRFDIASNHIQSKQA